MTYTWKRFVAHVGMAVTVVWLGARPALAEPLTPGNLIASVNEFTGSSTAPTYVAEYTPAGTRVQILANVPIPGGGGGPTTEQARDLILGPGNAIHLYNGTFDPFLARLDLGTASWTQQTFAGWSTVNNITYGGIGKLGPYVYVTDMTTFGPGDTPKGVVRFDTGGGPTVRFADTIEPIDLYIGPDGILYALANQGSGSAPGSIFKYDPLTFAALGTVAIGFGNNRALAVADDGSIIVATFGGQIIRYSATGTPLDSLLVSGANFADVDIDPATGRIALGTGFDGEIVLTDLALDSFTRFRATNSTSGGDVFVAWVTESTPPTIPEPSSVALLAMGFTILASYLRIRSAEKSPASAARS
jgi:hypothetical protein